MQTLHQQRQEHLRDQDGREDPHRHEGSRPLPTLLKELRDEVITLARQEFKLAKCEIAEEVESAQRALVTSLIGAGVLVVGGVVLALAASAAVYAGLLVGGVQPLVSGWLAPLIVGLVCTMIGLVMVNRAKRATTAEHWRPTHTERSLRETRDWAERKM